MDWEIFLRATLSLIFVIGLIGIVSLVLKRFLAGQLSVTAKHVKRLSIVENLPLDARRRLVIVQCDHTQHLLLLGATSELLIDNNIQPAPTSKTNEAA